MSDLWTTARSNDVEGMRLLFSKGIGLKARDEKGYSFLHHAAERGAGKMVSFLLDRGIEPDVTDNQGFTPLLRAVSFGQEETAKLLLEAGANPSATSNAGDTISDYLGKMSEKFKTYYRGSVDKFAKMNAPEPEEATAAPAVEMIPVRWGDKTIFIEKPSTRRDSKGDSAPGQGTIKAAVLAEQFAKAAITQKKAEPEVVSPRGRAGTLVGNESPTQHKRSATEGPATTSKLPDLSSSQFSRSRNSTITARAPLTKSNVNDIFHHSASGSAISEKKDDTTTPIKASSSSSNTSSRKSSSKSKSPTATVSSKKIRDSSSYKAKRHTTMEVPKGTLTPKEEKKSKSSSSSSSKAPKTQVSSINLVEVTDSLCKLIKITTGSDFGTVEFDVKKLFLEIKVLSTALKTMFTNLEPFANSLEDKAKTKSLLDISNTLQTSVIKDMYEAIKQFSGGVANVAPFKNVMQRLVEETSKIYSTVEGASVDDIVIAMQGSVVNTRRVVRWSQGQEEASEDLLDQTASEVVKLSSLVLDYTFADVKHPQAQNELHESCYIIAQAARGLIISGSIAKISNDDRAVRNTETLFKKVAEHVRIIASTLKPEVNPASPRAKVSGDMAQLFDEAMKLMTHSKDRYYTKAQENGLMADEKELMLVISEQIEQIKILKTAFLNDPPHYEDIMEAVISIINSISKTSELINPICLVCSNNVLIEELLLTLEAIIRCSVQIKLVASALCGESKTASLNMSLLAYIVRAWGSYMSYLLEAIFKALHSTDI
jgi:hypothetical protein